jgi:hypothetical protein
MHTCITYMMICNRHYVWSGTNTGFIVTILSSSKGATSYPGSEPPAIDCKKATGDNNKSKSNLCPTMPPPTITPPYHHYHNHHHQGGDRGVRRRLCRRRCSCSRSHHHYHYHHSKKQSALHYLHSSNVSTPVCFDWPVHYVIAHHHRSLPPPPLFL